MSAVPARLKDALSGSERGRLRLVRRRTRRLIKRSGSRRVASLAIVGAIGIAGIVAAILLEQVVLAQSAFELSDIRKELAEGQGRHEELLLEAARLDSAARIEHYAREQLGMIDPPPEMVRYIVADVHGPAPLAPRRRGRPGGRAGPGLAARSPYATAPFAGGSP